MQPRSLAPLLLFALTACGAVPEDGEPTPLVVFAAASLHDVAAEIGHEFERRLPAEMVFNFAGSNTLAQQIDAAPGADVFLSADALWVELLDRRGRTVPGSHRDFLSNRLVLVAHRDAEIAVEEPRDLAATEYRFLALADPEAVPAGRYARAHLERIPFAGSDLWRAVAGRVVPALDVRAALALVESDPEILGIVYKSDVASSPRVRVLHEFPLRDDVVITYRAVLVAGGEQPELGGRFLDFLASPEAREIAVRYGFEARPERAVRR